MVVYLGLILSKNIVLTTALFGLLGLCTPGKSNIAYIYVMEIVPKKMTTPVGTVLLIADGSTMIFLTIYFRYISKNWLYFQIFCISLSSVAFLIALVCPESPKYLFSYKKYKESRVSLNTIAKYNKVEVKIREKKYVFDTEFKENKKKTIPILSSSWNNETQENADNKQINKSELSGFRVSDPMIRSSDGGGTADILDQI